MQIEAQTILAVAVPTVGVVVWLVRLEGRVNLIDARYLDIKEALSRIEAKTDKLRSFIGGGQS